MSIISLAPQQSLRALQHCWDHDLLMNRAELVPSIRCFWRSAKHPSPDSDGIYTDFGFFKAGPGYSEQWFGGANIPGCKGQMFKEGVQKGIHWISLVDSCISNKAPQYKCKGRFHAKHVLSCRFDVEPIYFHFVGVLFTLFLSKVSFLKGL